MSPELSIITVNLNNAQGLTKTFESVFYQTFDNYEYIVIDGLSTDGSGDIIRKYSDKFSYSVSELDSGVYQAMNKGIEKAQGNYLLFLNSGDYLVDHTVLQEVFEKKHSTDIIACGCHILKKEEVLCTIVPESTISFGYLYLKGLNHQSTLIKRELFFQVGMYDENFKYNGDIEFWYRSIILNNASTLSLPIILTNYNLEGMSSVNSQKLDFKEELEKIHNHPMLQKFIPDYEKWRKIEMENKVLYWVRSKKIIFNMLNLTFFISKALSKLTKKVVNLLFT